NQNPLFIQIQKIIMLPAQIQLAPKISSTWHLVTGISLLLCFPRALTSLYYAPEIYSDPRNIVRHQKYLSRQPKRFQPENDVVTRTLFRQRD
ncbi:hypothetical protein, partial [Salmonella sp. s58408]|uniref:hypothetical protein n=1 Tax=Salmonella sp. s58408 TaxID=3159701 RepID=UPI003981374F